jgi:hypothetical protein
MMMIYALYFHRVSPMCTPMYEFTCYNSPNHVAHAVGIYAVEVVTTAAGQAQVPMRRRTGDGLPPRGIARAIRRDGCDNWSRCTHGGGAVAAASFYCCVRAGAALASSDCTQACSEITASTAMHVRWQAWRSRCSRDAHTLAAHTLSTMTLPTIQQSSWRGSWSQ